MNTKPVVLDYRGRQSHAVLDDIRELLLSKRPDTDEVEALVDTEKFARKIALFSAITKRHYRVEKKECYWSVRIVRPVCENVNGNCGCSQ